MATTEQILHDVLDWCIKYTNISESIGQDVCGRQLNFIHFAAQKGYTPVVKKLVESGKIGWQLSN